MRNFTFRALNLIKLISFVLLLFVTTQTRAQFPFSQSFKNNTAPGLQFGGSPVAFLTGGAGLKNGYNDPIGSGYLRLTNSDGNQKGITWSDTYAFPSAYGMTISFEYYTHGGNGADGIAFILFDATASPVTAGAFGGSLGYAQRNSEEGFSKGYLGIGIDEYGNFSANNEGKSGGVAVRSSNVTLRGKGTGLVGYPYLTSVQTTALASPFNVAGGDRAATDITKAGFRKMEVVLRPRSGGGFFIDVYLTHGSVRDLIINNYEYSTVSPSNLKFAISSSTGGSNNFHEIRNLNITVDPNTLLTPVASADSFSGCVGLAATSGDITANDNGTVNTLGTINKSTVDLDLVTSGIQSTKTVANLGTFSYDTITGKVTFTPINNTIVGPVTINYTFNDSYGKTSNSSTITYTALTPIANNVITAPSPSIFCTGSANPDVITGLGATGGTTTPLIYQWENSSDNITFTPISGATNLSYDPPLMSTTTYYRRIVTSAACSNTSNVVAIIFGQASTPAATSATTITCDGFTANWNTVSNAQSYGLFVSKNSDFSTHEGNYDGRNLTTATSYSITGLTTGTTYYYKVVAINTCGASIISSNVITVLVGSGSVPGSVSSPQTICSGTSPADLTLSGYAGTIQWQSSVNGSSFNDIPGATGPTLTSAQMGVLTANTYYRASVSSGACPATNSPSIVLTINPNPTLGSAAQAATVCAGSTARINLTGLLPSSTFTISYSIDGVSQIPISGISSDATGAVGFDSAVLPSSANGKILKITGITITSATPNCNSIVNKDVTLSVNSPSVGGNISSVASICAGTSPANLVLNGNTGTVVKWQKASDVAFSTPVDIAGTSTTLLGSTIGNLTANTYFRAIVKNGICSAEFSGSVLVTVNSLPAALSLTGSTICTLPGGNGKITSTTSVSGITYQLYNSSNIAVQTAKAGTGSALSWTGLSAGNGYYVIGTNTSTTCSSPSNIVDVVNDTQKPTIICPSNVTAVADANSCAATGVVLGTPTTTDNCTGIITVTNNAPSSFPIGVTSVTWTATDAAGNTQTCIQTVTVSDTQKPTITCPSNVTAVADANSCAATGVVLGTPTTSDNCIGTVTVTNNAPLSFSIGVTTVTWTATDGMGNTQTCTQTVTVSDSQKPTITCPSNVTAVADANSCAATGVVLGTPTTTDNCTGIITVTNNAPSSFPIGITTVTWTATDAAGNTQTCTQTVTVSDTQKPTITCPSNVTAVADANSCAATGVVLGTPTTSDNCSGTVTVTNNAPSSFSIGITTVTWTATDAAGNTQTCTQTVTVSDTQKPTITCPSNVTAVADANSCAATGVVLGTPTTTDNCTGIITVTNNAPLSFPIGNTIVTWTATDAAGNTQTCTQTITVVGPIKANDDIVLSLNGYTGGTAVSNVLRNDFLNCSNVIANDVNLTLSNTLPSVLNFNTTTGSVTVNPQTPAGTYSFDYTICEKSKPTNCSIASVTITVFAPIIDAVTETTSPINGTIGGTTSSLVLNDTLNGAAVVIGTNPGEVILSPVSVPAGLILNSDGTVKVQVGTPAGTYNVEYKICEVNNPTNCDSVISEVVVTGGVLQANIDIIGSVVGVNQPTTLLNVFANDTNNSLPVVVSDMNLTVSTADPTGYVTLNPDGTAILAANAPAGTYELIYQICEKLNPANCSSASIKVTVTAPTMTVTANSYCSNDVPYVSYTVTANNFTPNNLLTIKWIDSANNVVATQTNLPLTGSVLWPGAIVDSNQIGVDWPGWLLKNGQWTEGADGFENTRTNVTMQFSLNPTVEVVVNYPPATPQCNARPTFAIQANNDTDGPIDTNKGQITALNIFNNDTFNGAVVDPSKIVLSIVVSNPNLNLKSDGSIEIKAGTPTGIYQLTYQICDASNLSNCSQATVSVDVSNVSPPPPPVPTKQLIATDDTATSVDGINGSLEFINVLDNDLLNGVVINPANIVIKNIPQSPYFEFNPDGTVSVKPNTPGGNYALIYQICEKANSSNCITATLNVFVEVPAIAIIKTAVFNDENASGFANAGETITYKFKVTNTGNVPLKGITISDPLKGIILSGSAIDLNVNESDENNFTAQYKITQDDIIRGSVSNQASVQGRSGKGILVEDKSDDSSNLEDKPTVLPLNGCQIKVLNAFSPNGDSKNSRFYIQGLECYPDNTVEIYNRWGVLVFDIDHYNNEDRAFIGISAGRTTIKQSDGLPVGTYFYILKYKDSDSKPHELSGYVYISK